MLSIGMDATPLLGLRTGIGRYVEHLLDELTSFPDLDITASAFSLRGLGELKAAVPDDVKVSTRPFPANLLQRSWMHTDMPPVTMLGLAHQKVIHGPNFVLPPLGRKQSGVLTIHDLAFARTPGLVDDASQRLRALVPRGLSRTSVLLCPSQATADAVSEDFGFPTERTVITPLGVDPAWFEPQETPEDLPSSYLLAVGTQEPRKGLDVLLDALRLLHSRGQDVPPLVLVGPPGWGPALSQAGLPNGAILTPGWCDTPQLRRIVAGATALIFPSRDEGFGLPPLEAMAAGTPVVASDLPVTREVLGSHAVLTPVGSAEVLAENLLRILDSPRNTAVTHARTYTWQRCGALTHDAYERAAS